MEMSEIPFHRIFASAESSEDHIKCINKINTENNRSGCYFTSRNYRESSNNITEKHRPRITDNTGTAGIIPPEDKQCWNKNRKK